jgi:hypothetical protein
VHDRRGHELGDVLNSAVLDVSGSPLRYLRPGTVNFHNTALAQLICANCGYVWLFDCKISRIPVLRKIAIAFAIHQFHPVTILPG